MNLIGIDIGRTGAIALLSPAGDLVDVVDMPVLQDGPAHRLAVNAPLLHNAIARWRPSCAYVEFVGARPTDGPAGAFAFGRARGVAEGVLAANGVSVTLITPATWKRAVGIPPGKEGAKDAARSEAIRRWPASAELFARALDHDRAEAALIAVAGMMRESRHVA